MRLELGVCLCCDVVQGRKESPGGAIFDDPLWLLTHEVTRALRGWLILQPKRHVEHLAELSGEEAASLGPLTQKASFAIMRALGAERVYAVSIGEGVQHVHVWLVPRYAHVPKGMQLLCDLGSEEKPWACSDDEAADAAALVRAALSAPHAAA